MHYYNYKVTVVVICFTCHVRKARDLRETRICIINTVLENRCNVNRKRFA